jgi:hypothetical protein
MNKMTRRNVFLPDPLWARLTVEAERRSMEQGRHISVAELIREAAEALLSPTK